MARIVSFCYRTKKTAKGEARPTKVAIKNGSRVQEYDLKEVDHERDFAMGQHVTSHRAVEPGEDISKFLPRHCKWRKVEAEENVLELTEAHLRNMGTENKPVSEICTHMPATYEGLRTGDQVVMALGAGDPLAAMLFAKGRKLGVKVWRTPPSHLKNFRPAADKDNKDNDPLHLLEMFEKQSAPFYEFRQPDMSLVNVAVKLRLRMETQAQRIAAGNRLLQTIKDQMYLFEGEEEDVNEWIEERCKILQRDDPVYAALDKEEKRRNDDLEDAVKSTEAWRVFEPIEGIGPRIAAGILCVGDIRRFMVPMQEGPITAAERQRWEIYRQEHIAAGVEHKTLEHYVAVGRQWKAISKGAAKMMAYCGLHTMPNSGDGPDADFYRVFPRHKTGEVGNWSTDLRQAFYQLGEQWNKKPGSFWGAKLLQYKDGFYQKHPNPIACDRKLTKLFRALELFFRTKAGVQVEPADCKIASVEDLSVWFSASRAQITQDKMPSLQNELLAWQAQIAKAQTEGKTVKLFTPGHLLKMAKWRVLTRFCRWLFPQLVQVMGAQIESKENAA